MADVGKEGKIVGAEGGFWHLVEHWVGRVVSCKPYEGAGKLYPLSWDSRSALLFSGKSQLMQCPSFHERRQTLGF